MAICESCGKICYATLAEAHRAIGRFRARRGHHLHDRNRAYFCELANAWHLGHDRSPHSRRNPHRRTAKDGR